MVCGTVYASMYEGIPGSQRSPIRAQHRRQETLLLKKTCRVTGLHDLSLLKNTDPIRVQDRGGTIRRSRTEICFFDVEMAMRVVTKYDSGVEKGWYGRIKKRPGLKAVRAVSFRHQRRV